MPQNSGENPNGDQDQFESLSGGVLDGNLEIRDRELGAKVLGRVGFNERNKDIVESSFNKALRKNEILSGKNTERRARAYLSRLENLIAKYGNSMEKKLWQASIKDGLLVKEENVTEATWESIRQEMRDNGFGSIELTDEIKRENANKWRELQKESLEKWANYLGDEHSPYPLWFKVYAWDGMTKMGRYDKSKGKYETRNNTTIAPYPNLDPEILAGVFDVVNRYHGNGEKEFYTEEGERNINLERVAQSGNFSKIYNAIGQDIAPVIEPPEKAEDVKGEWVEYNYGEEDDIARAAGGTGWCVATPSVGRHYLEYGTYGITDDYNDGYDGEYDGGHDDEYNDGNEHYEHNKAKFMFFHLIDPKTGKLAKNGCASIRLDPGGHVAEISGLKEGQALNDSVVGIVEEKAKSLPGGEEFLPRFADKTHLISLDRKMKNNEDLTKEDLEFLYEIHRPIATLDTYNDYDPRINELKEKYSVEYALDHGLDVDTMIARLDRVSSLKNFDILKKYNSSLNIDDLVSELYPDEISEHLDTIIDHNVNIDLIVSGLDSYGIAKNLEVLLDYDADIDTIVSRLDSYDIVRNIDTLLGHGANIDVNSLVSDFGPRSIIRLLDTLLDHGVKIDIDNLVLKLSSDEIAFYLDILLDHGADVNHILPKLTQADIHRNLDTLRRHGANV